MAGPLTFTARPMCAWTDTGTPGAAAGCNVSNCQVALNVLEAAEVDLRHSSLSFNEVALVGGGRGTIQNCQFWGNLHRSTIHLSEGALAATQARSTSWKTRYFLPQRTPWTTSFTCVSARSEPARRARASRLHSPFVERQARLVPTGPPYQGA